MIIIYMIRTELDVYTLGLSGTALSLILLWLLHAVENVKFRYLFGPCGLCRTFSNRVVPSHRSVRVQIEGMVRRYAAESM